MNTKKCSHDNIAVKIDGIEVDPCVYEEVERYENVTVSILKCKYCGNIEIEWFRQDNTEEVYL